METKQNNNKTAQNRREKQNCSADKKTGAKTQMSAHFIAISFIQMDLDVRMRKIES